MIHWGSDTVQMVTVLLNRVFECPSLLHWSFMPEPVAPLAYAVVTPRHCDSMGTGNRQQEMHGSGKESVWAARSVPCCNRLPRRLPRTCHPQVGSSALKRHSIKMCREKAEWIRDLCTCPRFSMYLYLGQNQTISERNTLHPRMGNTILLMYSLTHLDFFQLFLA